jgi:hypothetical protein
MPKIRDINVTETGRNTPATQSNAGLRYDGGMGRALSNLGGQISEVGQAVYRRQAQSELSDMNAKFAEARAEWTQIIDEETRNGTIDTAKAQERYQDYVNKMNQGFETAEGREYFERESARLGQYVTKASVRGQATVAGARAEGAWRHALSKNSSSLMGDPSEFAAVHQSTIESIDAQVAAGAIPASAAEKFKLQTSTELAKSAVRGWADLSPDIAQKKLETGEFDQYFDGDVKAQMRSYINQQQAAKEVEGRRREAAEERATKRREESWQQDNIAKLSTNELTPKEVLSSPMTSAAKLRWLKLIDEGAKQNAQTDPAVENELFRRINLPAGDPQNIEDTNQLARFVGKGIDVNSFQKLNRWIDKSPEGQAMKANRKKLIDFATARLVRKDTFGMADPKGEHNLSQFMVDLQEKESQFRKEGKPVADLYNPHSKDYFGFNSDKYKRSSKDIMEDTVSEMRRKKTAENPDMVFVTAPDGSNGKIPRANLERALKQGYKVQ